MQEKNYNTGIQGRDFFVEMFLLLIVSLFLPFASFNQVYISSKSNNSLKNWSFGVQAGLFSYFGDLSVYDSDLTNKIKKESGPAFGVSATKYFGKFTAVSGELISGQVKAKKDSISFESNIIEYNAQVQFDIIKLFFFDSNSNVSLLLLGGIGNVLFNSIKYSKTENKNYSTRVPEFIYFFGGRIEYHASRLIKVGLGISIKQLQNDKLDGTAKNSDYDYYSYANIGVAFKLNHSTQKRGSKKLNSVKKKKKRKR